MLKFAPTVRQEHWLAAKLDLQVAPTGPGRARSGPLRCDHCRRQLSFEVHRYWRMEFCCSACMTAYQQRLAPETKVKIGQLDVPSEDQISGIDWPKFHAQRTL
jgi:hypothetical protein